MTDISREFVGFWNSAVPELWISHPNVTGKDCFSNCTKASNYASIPDDWK